MSLPSRLSVLFLALAAALPLSVPGVAQAQTPTVITAYSFAVAPVRSLVPGTELAFDLRATPGTHVTLDIAGATAPVHMVETSPGVYQGAYTVRTRDRIDAASLVTARLLKDGRVMKATLDQSLVRGAASPVPAARILAFSVNAPDRVRAGDELRFSLAGVPGGAARVTVQGLAPDRSLALTEVSRGLYEGSYTVTRQDRLRGELIATGYLRVNRQEVSQRFERPRAQAGSAYGCDLRAGQDNDRYSKGQRNDNRSRADMTGAVCGSVTAVNKVEVDDDNDSRNVLGTLAGGVLGGVLGNQIGDGSGRDIARIVGAIGGAYAGNRLQKNRSMTTVYRVTAELDGGGSQTFDHAVDPLLPIGTRVKIVDGAIVPR